jgi:hypothetical protein
MKTKLEPADIEAAVIKEAYYVFPDTTLTICCLTLRNGYQVTGESACVNPANFVKETGEKYAREQAVEKIWMLEGYLLKESLRNTLTHL